VGTLRRWELTPVPSATREAEAGHAAEFLATLDAEILPLVEREYQGDPQWRVLGGSSLGGLFTLYAMLERPELFRAYVAISPATSYEGEWLFGLEERAAAPGGR